MIGFIICVLIICALVAAIWGRQAAQTTFGCILSVVLVLVGIVVLFVMHEMNDADKGMAASSTASSTYPSMGMTLEPLSAENGAAYGLSPGIGVYVRDVAPGSGAAGAGIFSGDYILSVDSADRLIER